MTSCDLQWGCAFPHHSSSSKTSTTPLLCPPTNVLLAQYQYSNATYLCRWMGTAFCQDILSIHKAIQVMNNPAESFSTNSVSSKLRARVLTIPFGQSSMARDHVQLLLSDDHYDASVVITIVPLTVTAIAASVTIQLEMPLSVYQQAALKKQLVGMPILGHVKIHLDNDVLVISSSKDAAWMAPSTQMTVIQAEQPQKHIPMRKPHSFNNAVIRSVMESIEVLCAIGLSQVIVVQGPSGVGKTYAVQQAVAVTDCSFLVCPSMEQFQMALQQQQQQQSASTILLLDDWNWNANDLLSYWLDRLPPHILVIVTTCSPNIPECLQCRIDRCITINPPSSVERLELLQSMLRNDDVNDSILRDFADSTAGFVAADLGLLVRLAQTEYLASACWATSLETALSRTQPSTLRSVQKPSTTTSWSDIGGDAGGAKTLLQQAIEWPRDKRHLYQQLALAAPKGILLYGPPGCAKTSLARAAATGTNFVSLSPADVYATSFVGDAEAVVRRAFAKARAVAPSILFFDELDAIVGCEMGFNSMDRGQSAQARVLSTFLNEMDGVDNSGNGVIVLAATNRIHTLDAALLRPGRFDKVIYVPPPDAAGRKAILQLQTKSWTTDQPLDLDYLASDEISGEMTGADIVGACREAAMCAIRGVLDDASAKVVVVAQSNLLRVFRKEQMIPDTVESEPDTHHDKEKSLLLLHIMAQCKKDASLTA